MFGLAILFGAIVGFALGLTGGGGGIFAVPLLVYGLEVEPREAVGISLASVGGTAFFGAVTRMWHGQVELQSGGLFALAGVLGAPLGSKLSTQLPPSALLLAFAALMLIVAQRMWAKAARPAMISGLCPTEHAVGPDRSACQRDGDGRLKLTSRCVRLLVLIGFMTGVLSGLFGVGGGFVIVPALVLFSGMAIHAAVATSLFVIVLVSLSGVVAYLASGNTLPVSITLLFLLGGTGGMWLGGMAASQLQGSTLQRSFSVAVVLVACFVVLKSTVL